MTTRAQLATLNGVAVTVFAGLVAAGAGIGLLLRHPLPLLLGGLTGAYLLFAIKVVRQWE